jgi:ribonuclease T1
VTGGRTWLGLVAAVLAAVLLWWGQGDGSTPTAEPAAPTSRTSTATASTSSDPEAGFPTVALADLPPEAGDTVELIDAGGPFPEDEDSGVFGNFEGLLPDRERGYYREYTVQTPGLDHRGARRIVAGSSGELYWTEDHYQSFERIVR